MQHVNGADSARGDARLEPRIHAAGEVAPGYIVEGEEDITLINPNNLGHQRFCGVFLVNLVDGADPCRLA